MATLYIVATPIGNLKDITLRALEVFKSVGAIYCEDTRVTSRLLKAYDIDVPLYAYHQHSNQSVSQLVIKSLNEGTDIAYVSDAGTPGIQDPGNQLVHDVLAAHGDIDIVPIPGPAAVTALAMVSGLPTDSFVFMGFVPKKKGRQKMFDEIVSSDRTAIFYESGHRIMKTLGDLHGLESRQVVVGRELTKKFETIYRGTITEVINKLESSSVKGEFVVIVEGAS